MKSIDIHAHLVPRSFWEAVDAGREWYGFRLESGAGAEVMYPLEDQFYGERGGRLRDPFGQQWMMSQHIEDVSPREMSRRAAAFFGGPHLLSRLQVFHMFPTPRATASGRHNDKEAPAKLEWVGKRMFSETSMLTSPLGPQSAAAKYRTANSIRPSESCRQF